MTLQQTRILCATDLLPRSEGALERAGLLTDTLGADLMLLHVVAPSEPEQVLEQELQQAQSTLRARAERPLWRASRLPGTAIRAGNPARLVVDEVTDGSGADLLVLGPHRPRPVRDVLEGTIAAKVLASRTCSVLIVNTLPEGPYRRVLLALDVSPSSACAIRVAEQLVLPAEASATIVHADEPPPEGLLSYASVATEHASDGVQSWRSEATRAIRELLRRESNEPNRFGILVEAGHTVRGILRAAERLSPDLLVMGTRGGGRLHRALLGSVANSVLHQVTCDVMVVPAGMHRAMSPGEDAVDTHDAFPRDRITSP